MNITNFPSHKIDFETEHKWIFLFLCYTPAIFVIRIDNIPLSIDLFELKAKAIQLYVVYIYVCAFGFYGIPFSIIYGFIQFLLHSNSNFIVL